MSPVIFLLALPALCSAYSWKFNNTPQQCQTLSVSVSGSGGKPPYRLLILPFGPSPLPNNIEARKIMDLPFSDNSNSISFQLNYPGLSQFVAVVSDATGFGSGGTSVAALVKDSSDASCFDTKSDVSPLFVFSITPPNQIVQCVATRIWWNNSTVQGTPNFLGVIPGGQSFSVPRGPITDEDRLGTGFSWTPSLRGGTTLILVGGDDRGNGTAGSVLNTVSSGTSNVNNCLNDNSPSSTPGNPAGGSYPTSQSGGTSGGSGGSGGGSKNVAAIIGGVVGGLVGLAVILLLLLYFQRRRSTAHSRHEKRVLDLLNAEEEEDMQNGHASDGTSGQAARRSRNDLPEYYQPQPFTLPDPTSASAHDTNSDGRPLSSFTETDRHTTTTDFLGSLYAGAPGDPAVQGSTSERKGSSRPMRPVNVIQHDDAGPSETATGAEEAETVELPPAYSNIKK